MERLEKHWEHYCLGLLSSLQIDARVHRKVKSIRVPPLQSSTFPPTQKGSNRPGLSK